MPRRTTSNLSAGSVEQILPVTANNSATVVTEKREKEDPDRLDQETLYQEEKEEEENNPTGRGDKAKEEGAETSVTVVGGGGGRRVGFTGIVSSSEIVAGGGEGEDEDDDNDDNVDAEYDSCDDEEDYDDITRSLNMAVQRAILQNNDGAEDDEDVEEGQEGGDDLEGGEGDDDDDIKVKEASSSSSSSHPSPSTYQHQQLAVKQIPAVDDVGSTSAASAAAPALNAQKRAPDTTQDLKPQQGQQQADGFSVEQRQDEEQQQQQHNNSGNTNTIPESQGSKKTLGQLMLEEEEGKGEIAVTPPATGNNSASIQKQAHSHRQQVSGATATTAVAVRTQPRRDEEPQPPSEEEQEETEEERRKRAEHEQWRRRRKHVLVLSSAGKPIYSRWGDENDITEIFGIIRVLTAMVEDGGDELRRVCLGSHTMHFYCVEELVYCMVTATAESARACHEQMLMLHSQFLSVIPNVSDILKKHPNYDVRRLLQDSDVDNVHSMIHRLNLDPAYYFMGLPLLALSATHRAEISDVLRTYRADGTYSSSSATNNKQQEGTEVEVREEEDTEGDHLFSFVFADERLVSVVQPPGIGLSVTDFLLLIHFVYALIARKVVERRRKIQETIERIQLREERRQERAEEQKKKVRDEQQQQNEEDDEKINDDNEEEDDDDDDGITEEESVEELVSATIDGFAPICLPKFNKTGYLWCYARCLSELTPAHLGVGSSNNGSSRQTNNKVNLPTVNSTSSITGGSGGGGGLNNKSFSSPNFSKSFDSASALPRSYQGSFDLSASSQNNRGGSGGGKRESPLPPLVLHVQLATTEQKLPELQKMAGKVETTLKRKRRVISGGGTAAAGSSSSSSSSSSPKVNNTSSATLTSSIGSSVGNTSLGAHGAHHQETTNEISNRSSGNLSYNNNNNRKRTLSKHVGVHFSSTGGISNPSVTTPPPSGEPTASPAFPPPPPVGGGGEEGSGSAGRARSPLPRSPAAATLQLAGPSSGTAAATATQVTTTRPRKGSGILKKDSSMTAAIGGEGGQQQQRPTTVRVSLLDRIVTACRAGAAVPIPEKMVKSGMTHFTYVTPSGQLVYSRCPPNIQSLKHRKALFRHLQALKDQACCCAYPVRPSPMTSNGGVILPAGFQQPPSHGPAAAGYGGGAAADNGGSAGGSPGRMSSFTRRSQSAAAGSGSYGTEDGGDDTRATTNGTGGGGGAQMNRMSSVGGTMASSVVNSGNLVGGERLGAVPQAPYLVHSSADEVVVVDINKKTKSEMYAVFLPSVNRTRLKPVIAELYKYIRAAGTTLFIQKPTTWKV